MNRVATPPPSDTRRSETASGGRDLSDAAFRTDIEGLRAVAVVAVVLFHAGLPGLPGGFIGVDIFFVISGFLITGVLWREASTSGTVQLGRFYAARARRLLPAAGLVLVATSAAAAFLLPPLQARNVFGDAIASALYAGNYRFAIQGADYLSADVAPSPLQHYWSLGVEEQFYLVWPALIIATAWLVGRFGRRTGSAGPYFAVLAVIAAASLALSLAWTERQPSWAFFSLPTRAWELAAGGLVALTIGLWRQLPAVSAAVVGWGGLALILVTCTQVSSTTPFPGTAALLPVLGTALVIGAGSATTKLAVGRLLSTSVMRFFGRVSYSWYLWHWPVLVLVPAVLGGEVTMAARLTMVVLSLGLAVLTLRLLENPARLSTTLRASVSRSLLAGAVTTAAAVLVAVVALVTRPVPVGHGEAAAPPVPAAAVAGQPVAPAEQLRAAVAASADAGAVPRNLTPALGAAARPEVFDNGCVRSWQETGQPECASGDVASATRVVLFGDSHAAMWEPALNSVALQHRWRLETLAKVTCPPLTLPIFSPYLGRKFTECEQWRNQMGARLIRERPALVVVDMVRRYGADFGFASYDPAWIRELTRLVSAIRATGAKVLVLGPVPDPQTSVPTCLSAHLDDASACAVARSVGLSDNGIAAEAVAVRAGGGEYADLGEYFCTAARCPAIIGNTLVYRDDNHITVEYAQALGPVLGELASRAMG